VSSWRLWLQPNWNKNYELGQWTFCGTHSLYKNPIKYKVKRLKISKIPKQLNCKILYYVTGCPLDVGDYKKIEIKKYELGQWTFLVHIYKIE